ncbi:hypothetical protein [Winogradskyella sp. 3972H.M.0a.05]|uniref:toxin-antitoxin system YwqK family antitoxin n=1 Tax=Winogradskyella sp. 3972H.M.0a.05 TaxID=2950277 RepID=UPI0033963429
MKLSSIHIVIIVFSCFCMSCNRPSKDENGILLFENLESRTDTHWTAGHSSFWFPTQKRTGPYMYLGDEKYSGPIVKYHPNGKLEFKGTYDYGFKSNEWSYYDAEGNLFSVEEYGDFGTLHDKKVFFPDGELKLKLIQNRSNDTLYFIERYADGSLKYMHHFHSLENDIERYKRLNEKGEIYEFFNEDSIYYKLDPETLEPIKSGTFMNGRRVGSWLSYFDNGLLMESKNYQDGELHGDYKSYHYNGSINRYGTYIGGDKTGEWIEKYDDGTTKIIANFKRNKLEGQYKEFHENGALKSLKEYYADQRIGTWKTFYDDGTLIRETNYD